MRVRIPGGRLAADVLLALNRLGGTVQLTSRGNLQLRGVDESRLDRLTEQVVSLGLLPSASHELVRNVVASPLTGLTGERPDLRALIGELDAAICGAPALADLPARFLFAIDDGARDVWSLDFDLGYLALTESQGVIALGSRDGDARRGQLVARQQAVAEMVLIAADFVRARQAATAEPRVGHRPAVGRRVWDLDGFQPESSAWGAVVPPPAAGPRTRLGVVGSAVCAGVPLGFLTADQAEAIAVAAAGGVVVVTPWRSVVIPGAARSPHLLRSSGLVLEPDSPWSMITACVGSPGCAKSGIDTRAVAIEVARHRPARPMHVSGCERRCGAPSVPHDELVGSR